MPIGELDIAAVPMVDARLSELHEAGFRRLVLDLRRVTFMDVSGLRLVLKWAGIANADATAAFGVIAGPPHVQRIFTLTASGGRVSFVEAGQPDPLRFQRGGYRSRPASRGIEGVATR